jgi:hypothetical protein
MYAQIKSFGIFFLSFTVMALTKEVNGDRFPIENSHLAGLIVTFLSTIGYAVTIAKLDSTRNIKGIHYQQAIIRGILLATLPVLLWLTTKTLTHLLLIPLAYSIFYFCFDLFYNHYRGEPTFYVGKEALTDRIVRWLNENTILVRVYPLWYIAFKASFVLISINYLVKYYL